VDLIISREGHHWFPSREPTLPLKVALSVGTHLLTP
jgi:hypothetical protein